MSTSLDCKDGQHFACALSGGCDCTCHGAPRAHGGEPLNANVPAGQHLRPVERRAMLGLAIMTLALVIALGAAVITTGITA